MKKQKERSPEAFSLRALLRNAAGWYVCLLVFLLPLKFGSLAVMPEAAGFFPSDLFSWLIINWPAHSFGVFSGAALLLGLTVCRVPVKCTFRSLTALFWVAGFSAAGLAGLINSGAPFYAGGELAHLLGVSAFCGAAYLFLAGDDAGLWRGRFTAALAFGVLLLCVNGLHQYFFGFSEMRDFIARQEAGGIAVSPVLRAKVADDRVYAAMVSANVLGGFLLLTVPVAVMAFRKMGRHFDPVRISVPLFTCVMLIPAAAVFLMTKTRGAFLCALVTGALYALTRPWKRWIRLSLLAVLCLAVAGGALYIRRAGRGFGSFEERADYLRTACLMLPEKPLTGHGWGEFFYRHMREKTTDTDESAHDPHNVFLSLILQAGLPAGAAASAALLLPLIVLGRRRRENDAGANAVLWGGIAFVLHCCCDINMQIPACLAAAGMLFIAFAPDEPLTEKTPGLFPRLAALLLLAAAGAGSFWLNGRCLAGDVAYSALFDMLHAPPGERPGEELILRQWRRVESLRKTHPFACNLMADHCLAAGDLDRAEAFLQESLKRDPRRPAVYARLAKIAEARREPARAALFGRMAYRLFPTHPVYKDLISPSERAILIKRVPKN